MSKFCRLREMAVWTVTSCSRLVIAAKRPFETGNNLRPQADIITLEKLCVSFRVWTAGVRTFLLHGLIILLSRDIICRFLSSSEYSIIQETGVSWKIVMDEEKHLWDTITELDSDAWWTVDRDDCNQTILFIGDKTLDEFLGDAEKSVVASFVQPIPTEFKFSHVKVQFKEAARKPALLPLTNFRATCSFLARKYLSECITADQFVEAWSEMVYSYSEEESENSSKSGEDGELSGRGSELSSEEDDSEYVIVRSNNGRINEDSTSSLDTPNDESTSIQDAPNNESTSSLDTPNIESNNSQDTPNIESNNRQDTPNNESNNSQDTPNNGSTSSQDATNDIANNDNTNSQETPNNNSASSQDTPNNKSASSQDTTNNESSSSQDTPNDIADDNTNSKDEQLLAVADSCVGTFSLNIEQLQHPQKSRQVRVLNEKHVETLKKSFLAAGKMTFQSAGSLIGLVRREDCPSVQDFNKAKLATYRVEIIDGNHRLEAQRRALIEASGDQKEIFSQRRVTLYVGLQDDTCLAAGLYCNNTVGKQHMSMSDMDMTELFRKILLHGFLQTTEEKLQDNEDLIGPKEFFTHVRDTILQLPAQHKKEDLKKKFDTFRLRLRIAQLSPRCYQLAMEFFKAEKARGHDLKASNFKWIQGLSEEDAYRFLCKATAEPPVTRKQLKEVAEEAEGEKAAKVMDKCQIKLKGGVIELIHGGRKLTYKHMEVTTGEKSRILTAKELQACLSGKAPTSTRSPSTGTSTRTDKASTSTRSPSTGTSTRTDKASTSTTNPSTGTSTRTDKASTSTTNPSTAKKPKPSTSSRAKVNPQKEPAKRKAPTTEMNSSPAKKIKQTRKLTREEQYEAAKQAILHSSPSMSKKDPYFEDVRLDFPPSLEIGDIVMIDPGKKQHVANDPWVVVVMEVKRSNITAKFLTGEYGKTWDVSGYDTSVCDMKKVAAKVWFNIFPLGTKKMPEEIEEKVKNLHEVSLKPCLSKST